MEMERDSALLVVVVVLVIIIIVTNVTMCVCHHADGTVEHFKWVDRKKQPKDAVEHFKWVDRKR